MSDDRDEITQEHHITRPHRPKDKRLEMRDDETVTNLPAVDWEINASRQPLDYARPEYVHLGLVQFPADHDKQANIKRALQLAWQAADEGAEIICFHEMFMLPWVFGDSVSRYDDLTQSLEDSVWEPFQSLAYEKGVVLVCSYFEHGIENRNYNSSLIIDTDGTLVGNYRKRHLPPDNERVHFSPGKGPFSSFPTHKGRIGVYICWDNFFPEGARSLALDHANIVFAPSAATELAAKYKWNIALQHNALVNGIPWVRINRCESPFYPHQLVVGAGGEILHEAAEDGEHISVIKVNYLETDQLRQEWPFMADRRPDLYGALSQ